MIEGVLFQLHGPLASWGELAVGEVRPSRDLPTRSAVLGLASCALGYARSDEGLISDLSRGYRIAFQAFSTGEEMVDYHTVQNRNKQMIKRSGHTLQTRRQLLSIDDHQNPTLRSTSITRRTYRQDVYLRVLLARISGDIGLEDVEAALRHPRWPLSLGRRSCPPALPLDPRSVAGTTVLEIFDSNPPRLPKCLSKLAETKCFTLAWDPDLESGCEPTTIHEIRDERVGPRRFLSRQLHRTTIQR